MKGETFGLVPIEHLAGLLLTHLGSRIVKGRLGQTLLEDSTLEEQFVGNDSVIHAHAALIKDAHDGFLSAQIRGDLRSDRLGASGHVAPAEGFT